MKNEKLKIKNAVSGFWLVLGIFNFTFLIFNCPAAPLGLATPPIAGPTNLVAWWTLNEGSGTTAADKSANGYTAYVSNSPTWGSGVAGTCLTLVPASSQCALTTLSNLNFISGTYIWWQNPNVAHNSATIRSPGGMQDASGSQQFDALLFSDNNWYAGWQLAGLDRRVAVAATAANWITNRWSMYAITWTPTNTVFFCNLTPLGTNTSAPVITNFARPFTIGRRVVSSVLYYFPGGLDDIRLYNTNLSLVDLTNLYNGGYASQR